jgi:hypothetical protein
VTDQGSVNCLDPGLCYSGVVVCVCKGEGHPKPDPALLVPQGTVSRDSAAMEGACDWATSTPTGCVATESGI